MVLLNFDVKVQQFFDMTKFFRHKMLIISILFTFCNIALPFYF